jgi:hypothetical protein
MFPVGIIASRFNYSAAFLAATGISDGTIVSACNTLQNDLRDYGLMSNAKLKALYPFVGGTADTHKYNFMDARDTNSAYRITWSGTITHDSNGFTGNGTNGYGNTNFNDGAAGFSTSYMSMGIYSRTNNTGTGYCDMGMVKGSPVSYSIVRVGYSSTEDFMCAYDDSNHFGNFFANTLGLFSVVRTSSTEQKAYQNGTLANTRSSFPATAATGLNYFLAARNVDGSAATYSNRNYAFAYIGVGLTGTEISNLYTAIQAFQTTLGRQV